MKVKHPNHLDRGLLRGFYFAPIRHAYALADDQYYRSFHCLATRLFWSSKSSRFARFANHRISYLDKRSLLSSAAHIFVDQIYKFDKIDHRPFIIDAGANIGLAQLYWKLTLPDGFDSICFEPDPNVFKELAQNISEWRLSSKLVNAALAAQDGTLSFTPDGADGGRLESTTDSNIIVPCHRLSTFIDRRIDFLKIDIEGAELQVLQEIETKLDQVDRLFVEYHQYDNQPNGLGTILEILETNKFNYWIQSELESKERWISTSPIQTGPIASLRIFGQRDHISL